MENNKISVQEYLNNKELLEVVYIPFDSKITIVSKVMQGLINATGGINTSMLRRIFTEVVIENISNIDMGIVDENDLKGFDQLCLANALDELKSLLGNEYKEFERILNEYLSDYIRVETNPAITISRIYEQILDFSSVVLNGLSEKIKDVDVEKLGDTISELISINGGVNNESK